MHSVKLFIQGFLPAFCCFSLAIMAAVLWVTPISRSQDQPIQSYINIPNEDNSLNLLAIHADEQLYSVSLLSFNARKGTVSIHSFPTDSIINGVKLSKYWEIHQEKSLKALLSSYTETEIQRQLVVNDRQLAALLEFFAPISAVLEEPLSYTRSGLPVTLEAGTHQLSAEQCLHYLLTADHHVRARRCEELLCNAINSTNSISLSELQENFLLLLDLADTDLNISDFDHCASAFFFMLQLVEKPAYIQ